MNGSVQSVLGEVNNLFQPMTNGWLQGMLFTHTESGLVQSSGSLASVNLNLFRRPDVWRADLLCIFLRNLDPLFLSYCIHRNET